MTWYPLNQLHHWYILLYWPPLCLLVISIYTTVIEAAIPILETVAKWLQCWTFITQSFDHTDDAHLNVQIRKKNKCQVCIFSIAMNELRMDSVTCCNFDASITCSIQHASTCKNDNSRSEPFSIDRRASDHAFLTLNGDLWKGSEKAQFLTMFLPAEINILGELWNCPCSIYTKHRDIPPTGWPSKPRMQTQWWKTKFYISYVYNYLAKMHHRKPQTAWANIEHDCHV